MKKLNETSKTRCPVCGGTVDGEYDICGACGWENDPVQAWKPTLAGGANQMSLNEAREAYKKGEKIR